MRRSLLVALFGSLLALSACSAPDPGISAFADGQTVRVSPLQYCTELGQNCKQDGGAAGRLDVPAGSPVQLSVDSEIADDPTPWIVEYRMLDDKGQLSAGCDKLSGDSGQYSHTVRPPQGQRLQMINVYKIGAMMAPGNGGITFFARGTWTLLTSPNAKLPKPGEALCPTS